MQPRLYRGSEIRSSNERTGLMSLFLDTPKDHILFCLK